VLVQCNKAKLPNLRRMTYSRATVKYFSTKLPAEPRGNRCTEPPTRTCVTRATAIIDSYHL